MVTDKKIIISLDAMSGDIGAEAVVPAAIKALNDYPNLHLILVGLEQTLKPIIGDSDHLKSGRLSIHHCTQVVEMDESPQKALKNKKDSSMRIAINLVHLGQASACVSSGNTGALMATARFVLRMLPGIERPAICTAIPSMSSHVYMLDLGANVDSSAEHLAQFALMGSILAQTIDCIEQPKVALLNIGEEEIKGNEQVKSAAALIEKLPINYVGFIEGNDIFSKDIQVVVADGFVGNVALKTIEGTSKLIGHFLNEGFKKNLFTKIAAFFALPVLKNIKKKADPRKYNGACLLGLGGIVVKSHGNADEFAFYNAIVIAIRQVEQETIQKLKLHFSNQIEENHNNEVL